MADAGTAAPLVEVARSLRPLILEHADAAERESRYAQPVIDAMREAGIYRALVPTALGGLETTPAELLAMLEELARADASAAWLAMIGSTSGLASAFIDPAIARELFTPGRIAAGVVAPRGTGRRVEGGLVLTGRWPFASGCQHSSLIGLSCMIEGDGTPPSVYHALVPMGDVEVLDTWDVSGLRATGSHDVVLHDVFVPEGHGFSFLPEQQPHQEGALYRFPLRGLLSAVVAAVALGTARGALEDLRALATVKTPTGRQRALAEMATTQVDYARAEGRLHSGRAFLFEMVEELWQARERGERPSEEQRTLMRLASTAAVDGAVAAVDAAYTLAGATSLYATSPLQRRFRDIHAITQHIMVTTVSYEAAGRALLGLTAPPGFL
jgi:alkylation response protein AidB-like acyl-CoA dehydrogenase